MYFFSVVATPPHFTPHFVGQWNPPSAPLLDSAPAESSHLPVESTYFLSCNRNKRSCTINFKHPEGLKVLHDLVRKADVLVENFVPGKLAGLGLGWEDCQKLNDKLIYASISGTYGSSLLSEKMVAPVAIIDSL